VGRRQWPRHIGSLALLQPPQAQRRPHELVLAPRRLEPSADPQRSHDALGNAQDSPPPNPLWCMDIANLGGGLDPFADLDAEAEATAEKKKKKKAVAPEDELIGSGDLIHIRVQQRNGRKCITTVQGLSAELDLKKIMKALKKDQCCNGTVVEDDDMGSVLQLQGDQRDAVEKFLVANEIATKDKIKKHGTG